MQIPLLAVLGGVVATFLVATLTASTAIALTASPPAESKRFEMVDGLRGYLALSVLVHHAILWLQVTHMGGRWAPLDNNVLNQLGAGAVGLFFMVTGLFFYPRIAAGINGTSWAALVVTRLFRIVPLTLASVLIITLLIYLRYGGKIDATYPQAVLTWLTGYDEPPLLGRKDSGRLNAYVLWSIWFEWVFYFVAMPILAAAADFLRNRVPNIVLPLSLIAIGFVVWRLALPYRMLGYLPLFAGGMIAFECQKVERIRRILASGPVAALAAIGLAFAISWKSTATSLGSYPFFLLFFCCVASGNSFGGILATRGAKLLGDISFGIYLLHGICLWLMFTYGASIVATLPSPAALLILAPFISAIVVAATIAAHRWIELPGIAVGARIARALTSVMLRPTRRQQEVAP